MQVFSVQMSLAIITYSMYKLIQVYLYIYTYLSIYTLFIYLYILICLYIIYTFLNSLLEQFDTKYSD